MRKVLVLVLLIFPILVVNAGPDFSLLEPDEFDAETLLLNYRDTSTPYTTFTCDHKLTMIVKFKNEELNLRITEVLGSRGTLYIWILDPMNEGFYYVREEGSKSFRTVDTTYWLLRIFHESRNAHNFIKPDVFGESDCREMAYP